MSKRLALSIGRYCVWATIALPGVAQASEAITYTYDALGRLTQSSTSGGVDNGLTAAYTLDPADNRIAYTITGSPGSGVPDVTVIVLPLNGFTIIPIVSQP